LAFCMAYIGVRSFIPLYLSNHGQKYNAKLLLSQKHFLISKQQKDRKGTFH